MQAPTRRGRGNRKTAASLPAITPGYWYTLPNGTTVRQTTNTERGRLPGTIQWNLQDELQLGGEIVNSVYQSLWLRVGNKEADHFIEWQTLPELRQLAQWLHTVIACDQPEQTCSTPMMKITRRQGIASPHEYLSSLSVENVLQGDDGEPRLLLRTSARVHNQEVGSTQAQFPVSTMQHPVRPATLNALSSIVDDVLARQPAYDWASSLHTIIRAHIQQGASPVHVPITVPLDQRLLAPRHNTA